MNLKKIKNLITKKIKLLLQLLIFLEVVNILTLAQCYIQHLVNFDFLSIFIK